MPGAPETNRPSGIETPHGRLSFPAFLPDASRAVVKSLDAADLEDCRVPAIMVNVFHLANAPGASVVAKLGGVHSYMGWSRPIASDSGGFQVFSLLHADPRSGSVTPRGFVYRRAGDKRLFTPAKSIRQQLRLASDILFCLDHCTHPDEPPDAQKRSVSNTIKWARECKSEFDRALSQREMASARPLLFAVVQGGQIPELRRECAEALLAIGFDGYGFGGWPIDTRGRLVEMVPLVAGLLPANAPKHALGIGKPENVVAAWRAGYTSFDSTLPTRDARRGRLFVAKTLTPPLPADASFYEYLYVADEEHRRGDGPIDPHCPCPCCARYSLAYLHHLFRAKDCLAHRLATLHNLHFYARLMSALEAGDGGP